MKRGVTQLSARQRRLAFSLFLSTCLSVSLFLLRIIGSGTNRYGFMLWNLFLAFLPLVLSEWLVRRLRASPWLRWQNIVLTMCWLSLLPNSFYMITDLVHLQTSGEINIMFDTVIMVSFIFNGLVLGYMSVYQIHRELLKRLSPKRTHVLVATVMLAVSFAIYLGRSLRWNSWDILTHPTGLLFDVSDRLIHPISYPEAFLTTTTFFLLLGAMYIVIWQLFDLAQKTPTKGS